MGLLKFRQDHPQCFAKSSLTPGTCVKFEFSSVLDASVQLLVTVAHNYQPRYFRRAMKILIVGASGMIGGEALLQCLAHPSISRVVAFVRRNLPADVSDHLKLECILIKDFAIWSEDVLQTHADAAAMIW
jgi:hypothetical protein